MPRWPILRIRRHFKEGKGGFEPDDTVDFKKQRWHFASGEFLIGTLPLYTYANVHENVHVLRMLILERASAR